MPLRVSLAELAARATHFNQRVQALREQGIAFPPAMDMDTVAMVRPYRDRPRGVDTAACRLSTMLCDVERAIDEPSRAIAEVEGNHLLMIERLVRDVGFCIRREIDAKTETCIGKLKTARKLHRELDDALNADAVWLRSKRELLERTNRWLRVHLPTVRDVRCHEVMVWRVLRRAASMGLKTRRQSLLAEYFPLVVRQDQQAEEGLGSWTMV